MPILKPELLAPAGNVESFYAALNAGANAIFLGLQEFNARGRATNFSRPLLRLAVKKASEKGVKIYVTINILIKNREIDQLIDTLSFLDAVKVDGIIIQDWGVYYLAGKYFPHLRLHASTQMGVHNSVGVNFCADKGIKRSVLARELTMHELESIAKKSKAELEVFVHGALCYSFSGMCLFSSYIGGQGANRGICKQSCRRNYSDGNGSHALFSLKDNLQINNLQKLSALGINSMKVEGRMKSADYVYQVCKAYRMAIDHPEETETAASLLELDMGREKTSWFLGGTVGHSIAEDSSTGRIIGTVVHVIKNVISIKSAIDLAPGYRLRIRKKMEENDQLYIKLDRFRKKGDLYEVETDPGLKIDKGDEVLLVRLKTQSFPSRLGNVNTLPELKKPAINKQAVKNDLLFETHQSKTTELFVRIDSPEWLSRLRFNDYEAVILSYKRRDWENFDFQLPAYYENKQKIRIELPKFISEKHLEFYTERATKLYSEGYNHFFVSHLSQKQLLPQGAHISCNENVYILNDASAKMLYNEKINDFVYPLENDLDNLLSMTNKQGIVPMYFYPPLFYSRMPVKSNPPDFFTDETNKKFRKIVRDGVTIVYPTIPVALFHFKNQLEKNGFSRFLIDYSGETMTANVVKRVLKKILNAEAVQPSTNFNFKLGLK
jgi:U32 family peptidase